MSKKFIGCLNSGENVIIFNESNIGLPVLEENFTFPTIGSSVEFQMDYELDAEEWFFVELNEEDREKMIDKYKNVINNSADINAISSDQYNLLDSLFLIEEEEIVGSEEKNINIIFNRIFGRFSIATRTFLDFEFTPKIKKQNSVVDFNSNIDAYWDDSSNKLYFKYYKIIKAIFPGIEKFYRTATQEEVDEFLGNDFFEVEEGFKKDKLGERLQKNIADIIDNGNIDFSDTTVRTKYNNYATEFLGDGIEFTTDGKFKIGKNKELTSVVKILRGCYYLDYLDSTKKMETNNPKNANL